jgi:septal ring factor EnvC (AmiA/AmiB activator)
MPAKYILFFLFWLGLFSVLPNQTLGQKKREQLEQQRKDNQRKLQEYNRILEQTELEKDANIGQLNALSEQVKTRKEIIADINSELTVLQEDINQVSLIISGLNKDLEALKREYGAMIYAASKVSLYNRLMFVFSAKTFNQFVSRLQYLRQYAKARREQVAMMGKLKENKIGQQKRLAEKLQQKEQLLDNELSEKEKLLIAQSRKEQVIKRLSKKELKLKDEIKERIAADKKLERLISELIKREMKRAARAAKARARKEELESGKPETESSKKEREPKIESGKITLTPESRIVSNKFVENKGRMNWPVEAGFISSHFGRHEHPVLKGIMVDNLGIDIQTNANQSVKSVFDGEIGFVANVPGLNGKIVSVIHGDYITVYCNLKDVTVGTGDKVKAKQVIGEVYTDREGVSTVQFQVWKNSDRLNPESWLLRK